MQPFHLKRERGRPVDRDSIIKIIEEYATTAEHFFLNYGNQNLLKIDDIHEWLNYAPVLSHAVSIVLQKVDERTSKRERYRLNAELYQFADALQYFERNMVRGFQYTKGHVAWEILETKRVKPKQLGRKPKVLPAILLLQAVENRDYFQYDLNIDLSEYDLPYLKEHFEDLYYKTLENAAPVDRFDETETVMPLSVFLDTFHLACLNVQTLDIFAKNAAQKIDSQTGNLHLDDSSATLLIRQIMTEKYPSLKNLPYSEFQSQLTREFVKLPSEIRLMLGNSVLCVPHGKAIVGLDLTNLFFFN